MATVKTGSVTYAVRDTEVNGKVIVSGNKLGLVEGKILEVGEDTLEVAEKVIEDMIDDDSELITLYYGEDITKEEVEGFVSKLEEKYRDFDIQYYEGNQPIYSFFISVE